MVVRIARRTLQILVVSLTVLIPLLGLYEVLMENYRLDVVQGDIWQRIFYRVDDTLRYFTQDPVGVVREVKGTFLWSLTVAGYTITDPLAALGITLGGGGFYLPIIKAALPLILLTLLLGRVYCGWICPADLLFEVTGKVRKVLGWFGIRPLNISFSRVHKYILIPVGLVFTLLLGVQVYTFIYPPALLSRDVIHLIYYGSAGVGVVFLTLIILFQISLSERAWCRYFCPGGALYSLLGAKRLVRVHLDTKLCDLCGECDKACEFGLSPMRDQMGMECNNCGECIYRCRTGALRYRLVLPWQKADKGDDVDREERMRVVGN